MTTGIARAGDVELVYETFGPSDGSPLLLVCGGGTQMVHWPEEFVNDLVGRGFCVTTFDNRDSGRSTHCANLPPYSLEDMADDAVAVLDALGWSSAHLFGISLGGMIAQVMAVRHPARVRSLTSMSSAPGWGMRISRPRLRTLLELVPIVRGAGRGREAAAEAWVRALRVIGSRRYPLDEEAARDVALRAYDIAHDPDGERRQYAAIKASGDRRAQLAGVRAPTLVVHGEDDPLQSLRAGRATAAAIPGARLVVYPGVGHYVAPQALRPSLLDEIWAIAAQADAQLDAEPPAATR